MSESTKKSCPSAEECSAPSETSKTLPPPPRPPAPSLPGHTTEPLVGEMDGYQTRRSLRRYVRASERGLPNLGDLVKLAQLYVDRQRRLWPDLAGRHALPEPSQSLAERLASEFADRFRSGGAPPSV